MTFDASKYEICDSAVLWLKDHTMNAELLGVDGKPVSIECYSPGSKEGVKALHQAGRAAQLRQFRMLRDAMDSNEAVKADEEHAQKLAGFTRRISDNFPIEPLALYRNPKLGYIGVQVAEFISKYVNFPPGSSASEGFTFGTLRGSTQFRGPRSNGRSRGGGHGSKSCRISGSGRITRTSISNTCSTSSSRSGRPRRPASGPRAFRRRSCARGRTTAASSSSHGR